MEGSQEHDFLYKYNTPEDDVDVNELNLKFSNISEFNSDINDYNFTSTILAAILAIRLAGVL